MIRDNSPRQPFKRAHDTKIRIWTKICSMRRTYSKTTWLKTIVNKNAWCGHVKGVV